MSARGAARAGVRIVQPEPTAEEQAQWASWSGLPLPLPPPMATPPELAWLPQAEAQRIYQAAGGAWPQGQAPGVTAYAQAYWPWIAGGALLFAVMMFARRRK